MWISGSGDGSVAWSDTAILFSHFIHKHWNCFLGFIPKVNWSRKSAEDLFNCFEIIGKQGKDFLMKKTNFKKSRIEGWRLQIQYMAQLLKRKITGWGRSKEKKDHKQVWWKRQPEGNITSTTGIERAVSPSFTGLEQCWGNMCGTGCNSFEICRVLTS